MGEVLQPFKWTKKQEEALKLINSEAREILLYGGGRSAKTFMFTAFMLYRALYLETDFHGIIIRNTHESATKTVAMETIPEVMQKAFPGVFYHVNKQKWYVEFRKPGAVGGNESLIWVTGVNDSSGKANLEKILGHGCNIAYFNEAQEISYQTYQQVLTRVAKKGKYPNKIFVDENPPAKQHWTYKRLILGKCPIDGHDLGIKKASLLMNPVDNIENIDPEYVKSLGTMSRAMQARFLHGEFSNCLEGGIFSKEMMQCEEDGRINDRIIYKEDIPLHAVFDVGMGKKDKAACWLAHFYEGRIECVDYLEATQTHFQQFLDTIYDGKGYRLKTVVLPHEAKNKNFVTGRSIRESAMEYEDKYGFQVPPPLPVLDVSDGINGARMLFPRVHFNNINCSEGIEALQNYHYSDNGNSGKPVHDWSSHGSDAFRYLCTFYDSWHVYKPEVKQEVNNVLEHMRRCWTFREILRDRGIDLEQ